MWNSNDIVNILGRSDNLVLFDVGAADFRDSVKMRNSFPNSTIYSFEPDKTNLGWYGSISKNYNLNIFPFGLSDENGTFKFYTSETLNGATWKYSGSFMKPVVKEGTSEGLFHSNLIYNMEGIELESKRLDSFCMENGITQIDFMHLDVQGAETKVIHGMGDHRPYLIFSETCEYETYETNTNLQEFDKLMGDLGYSIRQRYEYDTLYVHERVI